MDCGRAIELVPNFFMKAHIQEYNYQCPPGTKGQLFLGLDRNIEGISSCLLMIHDFSNFDNFGFQSSQLPVYLRQFQNNVKLKTKK